MDAVDPDGDRLFYRYAAASGSVTPDPSNPAQATYVHSGAPAGSDRLTVTVTDTRNASATATRTVPLQGNRAPQVTLAAGEPCHPPCAQTFTATASDPDDDELDYVWSGCASGHEATATCALSFPGSVTVAVTVSDGQGGLTTATATAEGVNRAPVVQGRTDAPTGEPRLLVFESDPDGDRLVCGWWGDCRCIGNLQSFSLTCAPPSYAASCVQRFACTDPFGATGEHTFTLRR